MSPVEAAVVAVRPLARRRSTLDGLRLGLLDNSKPNADVLLGRVAELLAAGARGLTIRRWVKPGAAHPAAMVDEIATSVDAVLTGSAD
jgi:hypothetical protein